MLTFTDLTASYCAAELLFCSVGIACELNRTRSGASKKLFNLLPFDKNRDHDSLCSICTVYVS